MYQCRLTRYHDLFVSPVELLLVVPTERVDHGRHRRNLTRTQVVEIQHTLKLVLQMQTHSTERALSLMYMYTMYTCINVWDSHGLSLYMYIVCVIQCKGVFAARVRAENVHNLSGMYIKHANTIVHSACKTRVYVDPHTWSACKTYVHLYVQTRVVQVLNACAI